MDGADEIQVIVFRVGSQELAFEVLQVARILRYELPASALSGPAFLDGIVSYEGVALPVVDLRKRLGIEPGGQREETRLIVIEPGGCRLGLVVDQVREVLRVDSTTIGPAPAAIPALAGIPIAGVLTRSDRTILIVNASRVLSPSEWVAVGGVAYGAHA